MADVASETRTDEPGQALEVCVLDQPALGARARVIAVCGFSQPRIGDQRVADGTPGARRCGLCIQRSNHSGRIRC